jgi:hypothetical protein
MAELESLLILVGKLIFREVVIKERVLMDNYIIDVQI